MPDMTPARRKMRSALAEAARAARDEGVPLGAIAEDLRQLAAIQGAGDPPAAPEDAARIEGGE